MLSIRNSCLLFASCAIFSSTLAFTFAQVVQWPVPAKALPIFEASRRKRISAHGQQYAEQAKEAAAQVERLRQELVGSRDSESDVKAA